LNIKALDEKPIGSKTLSNTGAKDMGARIDNLEYKNKINVRYF